MSKEEITNVINKLYDPKNFNYYTNYGYAMSLLISDADIILEYIEDLQQKIDKAEECISNFLCTEEYINVDGKAIADNYKNILEILKGEK